MSLSSAVLAFFIVAPVVSTPPTPLCKAAAKLLASAQTALRSGSWAPAKGSSPAIAISHLENAINQARCDQVIGIYALDLVDATMDAVGTGAWLPDGDAFEAMIDTQALAGGRSALAMAA